MGQDQRFWIEDEERRTVQKKLEEIPVLKARIAELEAKLDKAERELDFEYGIIRPTNAQIGAQ